MNPAQIQPLRRAHTHFLAATGTTCMIRRKVQAVNDYGGAADSWSEVGTVVCRLMPERDRRLHEIVGEREAMQIYYRLTVPYDADLRPDDEVVFAGDTYQVVALWGNHDLRTARRAVVVKVS